MCLYCADGGTQDQHDAIDLTDNSIIVLGNIPLLRRIRTLLLANNRIATISPSLHLSVPNLTTLVLTNNNVTELGDLEPLKDLRNLTYLSLLGNPVREKKWYREWLAWRIPKLRVLDFQRIRDKVGRHLEGRSARANLLTYSLRDHRNGSQQRRYSLQRTTSRHSSRPHYLRRSRYTLQKRPSRQTSRSPPLQRQGGLCRKRKRRR